MFSGFLHYLIIISLEMSDEPKKSVTDFKKWEKKESKGKCHKLQTSNNQSFGFIWFPLDSRFDSRRRYHEDLNSSRS